MPMRREGSVADMEDSFPQGRTAASAVIEGELYPPPRRMPEKSRPDFPAVWGGGKMPPLPAMPFGTLWHLAAPCGTLVAPSTSADIRRHPCRNGSPTPPRRAAPCDPTSAAPFPAPALPSADVPGER